MIDEFCAMNSYWKFKTAEFSIKDIYDYILTNKNNSLTWRVNTSTMNLAYLEGEFQIFN